MICLPFPAYKTANVAQYLSQIQGIAIQLGAWTPVTCGMTGEPELVIEIKSESCHIAFAGEKACFVVQLSPAFNSEEQSSHRPSSVLFQQHCPVFDWGAQQKLLWYSIYSICWHTLSCRLSRKFQFEHGTVQTQSQISSAIICTLECHASTLLDLCE
jgi:hypothetical protein